MDTLPWTPRILRLLVVCLVDEVHIDISGAELEGTAEVYGAHLIEVRVCVRSLELSLFGVAIHKLRIVFFISYLMQIHK